MANTKKKLPYGLGCNPDPLPREAYRLVRPLTAAQLAAIPTSYTIAGAAKVPVYDQGSLGSCTSFGSGNAFEIRAQTVTGTSRTSCHLQIYQCELVHDGNPRNSDVGSSLSTAAWVLENQGVAPESLLPYDPNNFGQPIDPKVLAAAKTDELLKATKLDGPTQQDTINNTKAAIASDYPAMFGMNWYNSFFSPDGSGNLPQPGGGVAGGHALSLFAFDDNHPNPSGTTGAFRGRNSWNASWGLGGDFYIGFDLILNIDDGFSDVWAQISETGFQPIGLPEPLLEPERLVIA